MIKEIEEEVRAEVASSFESPQIDEFDIRPTAPFGGASNLEIRISQAQPPGRDVTRNRSLVGSCA